MKILKYFLLLLLVVVLGLAIYAAVQPDAYEVKRTRIIDVPTDVVYNDVSDYRNWEAWGPWLEEDPNMTFTYGDQTHGVGASYSWQGKDGNGHMKMVETAANESITNELTFEGMGNAEGFWTFNPTDGGTEVTWGMRAEDTPYLLKFFGAISGGYDNMMGPMFERGLERLDSVMVVKAEAHKKLMSTWSLGEVTKKEMGAQTFIGYAHSSKIDDHESMEKIYAESLPKVGEYAMESGLEYGSFIPGAVITRFDEEKGEADFLVGVFLTEDLKPTDGMQRMTFAKGEVVTLSKFGNYGTGDQEAHMAIDAYLKENGLSISGHIYEMYVNDPTTVTPDKIQTDIYYPVR